MNYYIGKLLSEAGKHYGESIIRNYSIKLSDEVGKKYNATNLKRIRQFYWIIEKGATLWHQLSWSHYKLLITLRSIDEINYYGSIAVENLYSVRELESRIKSAEYKRVPNHVVKKSVNNKVAQIEDLVKTPILIKNNSNN